MRVLRIWIFFRASTLWAFTICLPRPEGTVLMMGLLLSSGFG